MRIIKFLSIIFLTFLIIAPAQAKLLISPLYVSLDNRERTSQIVISNISNRTITYRMDWQQKKQDPLQNGIYVEQDPTVDGPYLQDFAVFSPRQVRLKPGEKQTIRIGIRRPPNLPDGEYKSHFHLSVASHEGQHTPSRKLSAFVNMAYALPVVYRVGAYDSKIQLGEPQIIPNRQNGKLTLSLPVKRSGIHGVLGRIEVFHTPNNGERERIMEYGNVNMFPEIEQRVFDIPLNITGLEPGKMEIVFYKAEGKRSDYIEMDKKSIEINN